MQQSIALVSLVVPDYDEAIAFWQPNVTPLTSIVGTR